MIIRLYGRRRITLLNNIHSFHRVSQNCTIFDHTDPDISDARISSSGIANSPSLL